MKKAPETGPPWHEPVHALQPGACGAPLRGFGAGPRARFHAVGRPLRDANIEADAFVIAPHQTFPGPPFRSNDNHPLGNISE